MEAGQPLSLPRSAVVRIAARAEYLFVIEVPRTLVVTLCSLKAVRQNTVFEVVRPMNSCWMMSTTMPAAELEAAKKSGSRLAELVARAPSRRIG
jgi:hypothetical protein